MAIVYKEVGQPDNIKHSIELGWGVNDDAAMPPLHDVGPLFWQSFTCSHKELLIPNSWKRRRRMLRATCVHIHHLASFLCVPARKHVEEVSFPLLCR